MRAVHQDRYGPPDVLSLREMPEPVPRPGEIKIRVRASAVTEMDTLLRAMALPRPARLALGALRGFRRPRNPIPGMGFGGEIAAVGKGVTTFLEGDRVWGTLLPASGAWADYICVPANSAIVRGHSGLDHDAAASVPHAAMTALDLLHGKAALHAGQTVLVIGAASAVGAMAIQIARHLGAVVDATASADTKEIAMALGVKRIYRDMAHAAEGQTAWDLVLDGTGKVPAVRALAMTKPDGKFATPALDAALTPAALLKRFDKESRILAGPVIPKQPALEMLRDMLLEKVLRPVVGSVHPIEKIRDVHRLVEAGDAIGTAAIMMDERIDARV